MSSVPALIVAEAHAPRISSASTATNLEIASGGSIAVSFPGASHALDISTDAAETVTTLDSKAKKLQVKTPVLTLEAETGGFTATNSLNISAGDPLSSTLTATSSQLTVGTQIPEGGAKVETSTAQCRLSTADTAIRESGGQNRYRATRHEFFVDESELVTMAADKITFHKDVDIDGAFNSITGNQTVMQIQDPVIQLAANFDTESDVAASPTGVEIPTVPADASSVEYMSKFKASDGSSLFIDGGGEVDTAKAYGAGIFTKRVVYDTNTGGKAAAQRNADSRLTEPAWNVAGGQMRLVKAVPDTAVAGRVNVYVMTMRVTDEGYFEIGRLKQEMDYDTDTSTFVGNAPTFTVMQECM